jgi:hypothetical protein
MKGIGSSTRRENKGLMDEFWKECLKTMEEQVFPLESQEAKRCAIQAVHRTLRRHLSEGGEEIVLRIIRYPLSNEAVASSAGANVNVVREVD